MKRINKIDILRAIGIILMVLGHVFDFFGKFDRYIHTFHMPLFFIISGYLFRSKLDCKLSKLISQKAKRLLIPYISFAAINYVAWFFLERGEESWLTPLVRLVTYNTSGLPICGALWFLTALFWAEVFYLVIDRVVKNDKKRMLIVFTVAFIVSWLQNKFSYRLPLTIDTGLVCMGFLESGRVCKQYGMEIHKKIIGFSNKKLIGIGILLAVINAILAFVNPYVNIKSGWYGFIPLFWINAFIGVAACYMLSILLDRIMSDANVIKQYLISIGTGSIVYLGFNQLAILSCRIVLVHISSTINIWIFSTIVFAMVMVILFLISFVMKKSNCKAISTMFGI